MFNQTPTIMGVFEFPTTNGGAEDAPKRGGLVVNISQTPIVSPQPPRMTCARPARTPLRSSKCNQSAAAPPAQPPEAGLANPLASWRLKPAHKHCRRPLTRSRVFPLTCAFYPNESALIARPTYVPSSPNLPARTKTSRAPSFHEGERKRLYMPQSRAGIRARSPKKKDQQVDEQQVFRPQSQHTRDTIKI